MAERGFLCPKGMPHRSLSASMGPSEDRLPVAVKGTLERKVRDGGFARPGVWVMGSPLTLVTMAWGWAQAWLVFGRREWRLEPSVLVLQRRFDVSMANVHHPPPSPLGTIRSFRERRGHRRWFSAENQVAFVTTSWRFAADALDHLPASATDQHYPPWKW